MAVSIINQYMPLPNVSGAANYAGVTQNVVDRQGLARVDHTFSTRDQIMFHYIYSGRRFPQHGTQPQLLLQRHVPERKPRAATCPHVLARVINEARFGWHRGNIRKLSPRQGTDFTIDKLGIQGFSRRRTHGPRAQAGRTGFPGLEH